MLQLLDRLQAEGEQPFPGLYRQLSARYTHWAAVHPAEAKRTGLTLGTHAPSVRRPCQRGAGGEPTDFRCRTGPNPVSPVPDSGAAPQAGPPPPIGPVDPEGVYGICNHCNTVNDYTSNANQNATNNALSGGGEAGGGPPQSSTAGAGGGAGSSSSSAGNAGASSAPAAVAWRIVPLLSAS